ncbi:Unknown protein [Striga hermonthica]|uniref:Uncharacterized protein n=1 Tax=Striga hermonthica TaxID=68872 RepID=A0A9N7R249_STRHE|nr:Unknown protein [Striga hermonthica]
MNCRNRHRSHAPQPLPSAESIKLKMWQIVSRHEQLKVAFHQLHSQIRTGLLEAEEVFASLATPLTKLVGLKTVEMAAEGRFSTIFTSVDRFPSQQENYMVRATTAGNEFMERQKLQLMQLISLLKKIEAQVNLSQRSISQNLSDHQADMEKFFLKAFAYISSTHQSGPSNELFHVMLKILRATFNQVVAALESVEVGIDDLIRELAQKMCGPMVEYANGLKVEIRAGTCSRLLEVIKEMDGAMKVRELELEEARKRARSAEEGRIKAMNMLMKLGKAGGKMTMSSPGLLMEDIKESGEHSTREKSLGTKADQGKDEDLLWELLRKKRKCHVPDSPLGPNELLGIGTCSKKLKATRLLPPLGNRPVTRSASKTAKLQSSLSSYRLLLGSSPSTAIN